MRKGLWSKRIPTFFAFLLLFISIWVTSFLIQKGVIFVGRATPEKSPREVLISNITDSSFTVTFQTLAKTVAAVSIEEKNNPQFVVFDDRNKRTDEQKPFYSHYITVSDLKPKTIYELSILSDGEIYLNGEKKYIVTTGPLITGAPPVQNPIVGKVLLPDGSAASDTIVVIAIEGAQSISSLTKDDGTYIIPTNSIKKTILDDYLTIDGNQEIQLKIIRGDMRASVKSLFKDSELIPPLTLQKNYDFTKTPEQKISSLASQLKVPPAKTKFGEVKILNPKPSESLIDNKPLFRGVALPNKTIKITIESNPIKTEVISDNNGSWSFRPSVPLSPGEHTITIETQDNFGILKTISQKFTVFASGAQVAESATPSATPAITITPTTTQAITPTVFISPSATPLITQIPTIAPTVVVTIPPTIPPITIPITTPAPPGSSSSLILTSISIILIFTGSVLLFLL
ncbi:MAG: hypothetical protein A3E68_01835 [Candidatus Levybacteria bacterium RIFCSPHIGHO2_12_FULL_39_39]|nr:MAG: hypothetical protein UT20_C0046G0007 [Candidatus Levybacteria bacterium GW2011_GWA1_39_11]OGH25693.1 MAG: hypothetical protein A3E68_01835 [Candidatus Levybacteria bacterium RIFCSPHIGHO2_12_FULL_39_39]